MAAKKKKVRKKHVRRGPRTDDPAVYAEFAEDLQNGSGAIALHESRNPQGALELEFDVEEDDP